MHAQPRGRKVDVLYTEQSIPTGLIIEGGEGEFQFLLIYYYDFNYGLLKVDYAFFYFSIMVEKPLYVETLCPNSISVFIFIFKRYVGVGRLCSGIRRCLIM